MRDWLLVSGLLSYQVVCNEQKLKIPLFPKLPNCKPAENLNNLFVGIYVCFQLFFRNPIIKIIIFKEVQNLTGQL
jgi:hypothetical protein